MKQTAARPTPPPLRVADWPWRTSASFPRLAGGGHRRLKDRGGHHEEAAVGPSGNVRPPAGRVHRGHTGDVACDHYHHTAMTGILMVS